MTNRVQEKDAVIKRLEVQLEKQVYGQRTSDKRPEKSIYVHKVLVEIIPPLFPDYRSSSEPRRQKLLRRRQPRLKTGSLLSLKR